MKIFTVDAFAEVPFSGNQAAVCVLNSEQEESWMQQLAREMNYSETAFVLPNESHFELRWFTPEYEVDLCGHATLATAHVLWNELACDFDELKFNTRSGTLQASRESGRILLDFPSTPPTQQALPAELFAALGVEPIFSGKSQFDAFVVLDAEDEVRSLQPNFEVLAEMPVRGVIVTAKAGCDDYDFVSRFFAPSAGINEDPVTGSAHCCLAPYWSEVLGNADGPKLQMRGYQASRRGGVVGVEVRDNRVILSGTAVTIIRGDLAIQ